MLKDSRIKVIRQKNSGLALSLNKGISIATGAWIARMDADDVSMPMRLEKQLSYLEKHPEIDVLGTAAHLKAANGEDLGVKRMPESHDLLIQGMHKSSPFIHPSVMMRRKMLMSVGGYSENIMRAQDYELWSRIFKKYTFHNLQEPLLIYTVTERVRLKVIMQSARVRLIVGWRMGRPISSIITVAKNVFLGILCLSGLHRSREFRGGYQISSKKNGD